MPLRAFIIVLPVIIATLSAACSGVSYTDGDPTPGASASPPEATPVLRTIEVRLEERAIEVEVADDPPERTQGLSDRDSLPAEGGMLFVWDEPAAHTLWMKNMRIPLDFVWIDAEKRVIEITPDVPNQPGAADADLVRYSPATAALYAIELNAGAAERFGIEVGDMLTFDEDE